MARKQKEILLPVECFKSIVSDHIYSQLPKIEDACGKLLKFSVHLICEEGEAYIQATKESVK